jgi:signal transduction histidine kinase
VGIPALARAIARWLLAFALGSILCTASAGPPAEVEFAGPKAAGQFARRAPAPPPSALAVTIPWQEGWFRAVLAIFFLGAGPAFYFWRTRQIEGRRVAQEVFARRLLDSQEQERKRIAAELHDSLGQTLLVVRNLALQGASSQPAGSPVAAQFQEISAASAAALAEVRAISLALRPVELDRLGLSKSVAAAAQRMGEASGIHFDLRIEPVDGLLPAGHEIHLYRIIQECLNNLVKHSQARTALIELKRGLRVLELAIADDGCGFNPAAEASPAHSHGLGLMTLVERARALGGLAVIHSRPGGGTRLDISVPIAS